MAGLFRPPAPLTPPFIPEMRRPPVLLAPVQSENAIPAPPPADDLPPAPPEQEDQAMEELKQIQAKQPPPLRGLRGMLSRGIIPSLLNPRAADQEQYEQDIANFTARHSLQRQQEQDATNKAYRESLTEDARARADERVERQKNADLGRETTLTKEFGSTVQPGEVKDESGEWEYTTIKGEANPRKKRSAYGLAKDKKSAEEANYRAIPDPIADALKMQRGTKVPPNELDAYIRILEQREQREADRTSREMLAREAREARAALAALAVTNRSHNTDFRNTMQMSNAYRNEQAVKSMYDVKQAYQAMSGAGDDGAGDVTLMRLFAKITDPTTGVREEEYRTMQGAGGVMNAMNVFLSGKWAQGNRLSPQTRASFLRIAQEILKNRQAAVAPVREKYLRQSRAFNVDPSLVITDDESVAPVAPPTPTHRFNPQTGRIEASNAQGR